MKRGQIIAEKYRIDRSLGVGGAGMVFAATHTKLDQSVAIKLMRPDVAKDPAAVERFLREGRAVVRLKSEHVARVLDVGTLEDEGPYIVMEYLEGSDLASIIKERGRMPVSEAVGYILQVCEAVSEAHSLGIVHRDLKPRNLFVTRRRDDTPLVKVLDFGIAKAMGFGDETVTRTEMFMGSPWYMPPEQMESARNVDVRSDIWSLGVVLYQMVTGRLPFEAESFPRVCTKVLSDPPTPMIEHSSDLPPGFEVVVLRCLEKLRTARYANVGEFARALLPYASRGLRETTTGVAMIQLLEPRLTTPSVSSADDETMSALPTPVARPRRRWLAAAVVAAVAVGMVGTAATLRAPASGVSREDATSTDSAAAAAREDAPGAVATAAANSATAMPASDPPPATSEPAPTSAPRAEAPRDTRAPRAPSFPPKAKAKTTAEPVATAAPAAPTPPSGGDDTAEAKSYR